MSIEYSLIPLANFGTCNFSSPSLWEDREERAGRARELVVAVPKIAIQRQPSRWRSRRSSRWRSRRSSQWDVKSSAKPISYRLVLFFSTLTPKGLYSTFWTNIYNHRSGITAIIDRDSFGFVNGCESVRSSSPQFVSCNPAAVQSLRRDSLQVSGS